MRRGLLITIALAGCYNPHDRAACEVQCTVNPADPSDRGPCPSGLSCGADGLCRDADGSCPAPGNDGGPPVDQGAFCFGSSMGLLRICYGTPPAGPLTLSAIERINTDTDPRCDVRNQVIGAPDVCVIASGNLTISGILRVVGGRPFVLLATDTIEVTGHIDASSKFDAPVGMRVKGAGGDYVGCTAVMAPGDAGGGAGGSFQTTSGTGGSAGGGGGGEPNGLQKPTVVRGGCPGGDGENNATSPLGVRGFGGGVVYMIAGTSIHMNQNIIIDASGAGGEGGAVVSGGGGGGSGGLIGFDAPSIVLDTGGVILANGGGGGQGGNSGSLGQDGKESPDPAAVGMGGHDGSSGGFGGDGAIAIGNGKDGTDVAAGIGGGGGGGGVGWVVAVPSVAGLSGMVSPPATSMP